MPMRNQLVVATVDAYRPVWRLIMEGDGRRWHTRNADHQATAFATARPWPAAPPRNRQGTSLRHRYSHTQGEWVVPEPYPFPSANREKRNGARPVTGCEPANSLATSLPIPVILKP